MVGRGWDKADRRGMALHAGQPACSSRKADAAFVKAVKEQDRRRSKTAGSRPPKPSGLKDAKKVLADFRAEIAKLEK